MKSVILSLSLCLLLAGCAEDIKETGITQRQAIAIAKKACPEYPDRFYYVDRAEWIPEKGYWAVLLDDQSGHHGRVYKIDRNGEVVGTRDIVDVPPPGYYNGPGPYYGGPWYDGPGPYYYGGPVVIGVYGHPYHHGWWH